MNNLRLRIRDRTEHEDFEYARASPSVSHYSSTIKSHRKKISRLREGYYDFAICWWGDLGRIVEIGEEKGGNYMLIRDLTEDKSVRERMSNIDWKNNLMICTGAPQLTTEMFVDIYAQSKRTTNVLS